MQGRYVTLAVVVALLAMPAAAAEKLKIGFINTFSGSAAVFGKHQRAGFDLAIDHLGGKIGGLETEVIYGDDQRKPDVAKQIADKMVKKNRVHFIVGITWSNLLLAIQKSVTRSETFLISTNAGASPMAGKLCSPYFFSTSWQNDQMPEALGQLIQSEGVKSVFAMAPNYQAGKDMITGFSRYYKGDVKGRILTKLGQKDYQAEISQVRVANPEALYIFLPGGMGIAFLKQWAASGLADKIKLYTVYTVDYLTLKPHGDAAVGTFHTNFWDPNSKNPVNQKFVADFKKKYGYMPSQFAAQAYDAPLLIDSAIKAVNGNLSDKDGIRDAMRKADFKSVRGAFKYNTNHMPIQDFYRREVVRGQDGKPKIVTTGVIFRNHADSYAKDCKMQW